MQIDKLNSDLNARLQQEQTARQSTIQPAAKRKTIPHLWSGTVITIIIPAFYLLAGSIELMP